MVYIKVKENMKENIRLNVKTQNTQKNELKIKKRDTLDR